MNTSIKTITTLAMMTALGIGFGYLFAAIPNFELITSTIFIAGFLFGPKQGMVVGFLTESIYSLLNPNGVAPLPMFISLVLSMTITGLCGGLLGQKLKPFQLKHIWMFALAGFLLTINFAFLTTLSYVVTISGSINALIVGLIQGLYFYIVHILSNTILFVTLVPAVIKGIQKVIISDQNLCVDQK